MTIPSKKWTFATALAAVALIAAAPVASLSAEQTKPAAMKSKVDKATFVSTVASAGKFEIDSSKLALDKATSKDVKKFARQMIRDHTKAGKRLASALKKEGGAAPPDTLSPKDAEAMKQLNAASGTEFEKIYISLQENAHMDAVALFKTYAADPDDKMIGRFAKNTLPTLEMHLEHVKRLTASQ